MNWGCGVMNKIALTIVLAVAAGVVCSAPAAHASTYTLVGNNVDLNLTTDGSNNITNVSGIFFGDEVDLADGQPGGPAFSPGNYFVYNNILLPNLTPAFDNLGLLLGYVSGPNSFTYGNISAGFGGAYAFYEYEPDVYLGTESLTLTATPLPATWTMLIAGLIGLGFIAHRGSKKGSTAIAAA